MSRPEERSIGVCNENVVVPAFESLPRGENGVSCAAPLRLHKHARQRSSLDRFAADVLPAGTDYNGDVVSSGLLDGGERVGEQGAAGNFVQHLRSIRTHPSAFAGRENHGQATADRTHVKVLPFGARPPRAGIAAAPEPHHRALRPKRPDGALAIDASYTEKAIHATQSIRRVNS